MNWEGSLSRWKNYEEIKVRDWQSIKVSVKTPVFSNLLLGYSCRRPDESAAETELRIASSFDKNRSDLILEIIGE